MTSIRPPTPQVEAFANQPGWETIYVADRKTPSFPSLAGLRFFSVLAQQNSGFEIAQVLPWDHYARKNLGYIQAIRQGSVCIFDTDDDNLPIEPWKPRPSSDQVLEVVSGKKWVNIYAYFSKDKTWPRGFPLEQIGCFEMSPTNPSKAGEVVVWQGLVAGDPDVDAIFRLTRPERVEFLPSPSVVLPAGSYCPFNSQNTLWEQPAFPYLYLPSTVSFRFTDILRGFVAQRCFWAHGWRLGFQAVTAIQERNPHDLLMDFQDELPCYLTASRVASILDKLELSDEATHNLRLCYEVLADDGIVQSQELTILDKWLADLHVS